jgi:hypothetical protein
MLKAMAQNPKNLLQLAEIEGERTTDLQKPGIE